MHSKRAAYRLTLTTSPNYFHLLFSNCAISLLRKIFLCSGNQREETTFVLNSGQKSLIDRFGDYETHLLHIVKRKHMTILRNPFDAFDFRNFLSENWACILFIFPYIVSWTFMNYVNLERELIYRLGRGLQSSRHSTLCFTYYVYGGTDWEKYRVIGK